MWLRSSIGFDSAKIARRRRELPPIPEIETPRLLLRRLAPADLHDVYEYACDPEVSRYTLWDTHKNLDETRLFLKFMWTQHQRGEGMVWGVVDKQQGKVIGTCGFGAFAPQHGRAELGFALARRCWRRGFTTEAVLAVLTFLFREMKLNRIEAKCDVENLASARVLEKSGMSFEGILRQHSKLKGRFRDLRLYAVLRSDFLRAEHA